MGRSPSEGGTAHQETVDEPTVELDVLEQTISIEGARALRHDAHGLAAAPIPRAWILEGNPVAREKPLAGSADGLAAAFMRDCTAGRFERVYDADEITHVLEGSVILEDGAGVRQALQAGDTLFFATGSRYRWSIPGYVRTISFVHAPLPRELRVVGGILQRMKAPFRR